MEETNQPRVDVSKEDALAALRAGVWTEHQDKVYEFALIHEGEQLYRDVTPPERQLVHTFGGSFGCDWELAQAEAFVGDADELYWAPSLFRHELHVRVGKRGVAFEITAPDEARKAWPGWV